MGQSEDWQKVVVEYFGHKPVTLFNPRRPDWDSSWKPTADDPQFFAQVNWELDALERCDLILMNLLPGSLSPISLLELGLFATSGKLQVCCPPDFWRSGNVEIVCQRHRIPVFYSLADLLGSLPY